MQLPEEFQIQLGEYADDNYFEMEYREFPGDLDQTGYYLRYLFSRDGRRTALSTDNIKVNQVRYYRGESGLDYVLDIEAANPTLSRSIHFGQYAASSNNQEGYYAVSIETEHDVNEIELTYGKYSAFSHVIRIRVPPVAPVAPVAAVPAPNSAYAAPAPPAPAPPAPAPPAPAPAPAPPAPAPAPAPPAPAPAPPAAAPAVEENENAPYEPINMLPPAQPNGSTRRRKRRNTTKRRRGGTHRRSKN